MARDCQRRARPAARPPASRTPAPSPGWSLPEIAWVPRGWLELVICGAPSALRLAADGRPAAHDSGRVRDTTGPAPRDEGIDVLGPPGGPTDLLHPTDCSRRVTGPLEAARQRMQHRDIGRIGLRSPALSRARSGWLVCCFRPGLARFHYQPPGCTVTTRTASSYELASYGRQSPGLGLRRRRVRLSSALMAF
jgi:hypothetical protein